MKIKTVFLTPFSRFGQGDEFNLDKGTLHDLIKSISKKQGVEFEKMLVSNVNNVNNIKDNVMVLHKGRTVNLTDRLSEGEYVFCAVIVGG